MAGPRLTLHTAGCCLRKSCRRWNRAEQVWLCFSGAKKKVHSLFTQTRSHRCRRTGVAASPCVSELHCDGLCHRFNFSHHLLAGGPRAVDHIRPDSYKLHLSTRASPKDSRGTARWNHLGSHPGCILSAWTCSLCFCSSSFGAE